jgi:hypothetical protein
MEFRDGKIWLFSPFQKPQEAVTNLDGTLADPDLIYHIDKIKEGVLQKDLSKIDHYLGGFVSFLKRYRLQELKEGLGILS